MQARVVETQLKSGTLQEAVRMQRFWRYLSSTVLLLTLTLVAMFGQARPAIADSPLELPAGLACDFALRVDGFVNQVPKEFKDKNGVVRFIRAGKGLALTFTNIDTGATLSLKPNGSVTHTTVYPNGTAQVTATGHDVLILFPSDVPAGPSTTLYVGKVVYTVDTAGNFTLQESSGQTTDLCAALS